MQQRLGVVGGFALSLAVVLGWLVWADLAPDGKFSVESDFRRAEPKVSELYPAGRVSPELSAGGEVALRVTGQPLYFDVRRPRRLPAAEVRLWYRQTGLQDLRLGVRTDGAVWRYDLKPVEVNATDGSGAWQFGRASFDLSRAAVEDGQVRFLIASAGLPAGSSSLLLRRVRVDFSGPPLTFPGIAAALRRRAGELLRYVR